MCLMYVCFFLSSQVFRAKELLDSTLALIKNAMSGAIVDPDRLVIGTEEGLFCLDLDRSGKLCQK
jgi:serine/threonine-protein kinase MRCK